VLEPVSGSEATLAFTFAGVFHTPVLAKDGGCQTIDMTHVVVETESLEADSKSIKLKTNSRVLS
jgi:hypothetical protein